MNKLLSIIIPTRDRQIYCIESVKSILVDIDNRCEIVVQDNSSDNSLQAMIFELNDDRIRYNYNAKALSFIDNFEEAINLSLGEYFIVLGDDDSTTKDILPIVEWMKEENVESVSSSFVVDYIWPNNTIEKFKTGYLSIPNYKGDLRTIDVNHNLNQLIKNGFLAYQTFDLPRTYHGIVKRSCMDKVKKIGSRYFGGLTPDIYSTIALSCVIKNHKIIDYPFSIAGACPASATVNATVGGHAGELKDAPHFKNRGSYEWEKEIPRYYSVETIWAETAIKALNDMGYKDWKNNFNKYKLYVYGIYYNKQYIFKLALKETLNLNKREKFHFVKLLNGFLLGVYQKYTNRKNKISQTPNNEITNVFSLTESKKILETTLKEVSMSIIQ